MFLLVIVVYMVVIDIIVENYINRFFISREELIMRVLLNVKK